MREQLDIANINAIAGSENTDDRGTPHATVTNHNANRLKRELGVEAYFAGSERGKWREIPVCDPYKLTGPVARFTSSHTWLLPKKFNVLIKDAEPEGSY